VDEKGQITSLGTGLSALGSAPAVTTGDEPVPAFLATDVEDPSPASDGNALLLAMDDGPTSAVAIAPPAPAPVRERTTPGLHTRRAALPPIPPDALSAALLLARRPTLGKTVRSQPLPPDIIMLIRIAAGSADSLRRAVHLTGKDPTFIRASAEFYLEEVLGTEGSDDYRALGLAPGAPYDDIAEHTRWLTRWLLPHLGRSDPEAAHLERVLAAWSRLRNPEGRIAALRAVPASVDVQASMIAQTGLPRWQIAAIAAVGIVAIGVVAISGRFSNPISAFATNAQEPASAAATEARSIPGAN
jgi:hypothetical protein